MYYFSLALAFLVVVVVGMSPDRVRANAPARCGCRWAARGLARALALATGAVSIGVLLA